MTRFDQVLTVPSEVFIFAKNYGSDSDFGNLVFETVKYKVFFRALIMVTFTDKKF